MVGPATLTAIYTIRSEHCGEGDRDSRTGQDRTGQMGTRTGKPVVVFVIVVVALDVYHTTGDDSKKKKEKRRGECSTCYPPPGLRL